MSGHSHFATIKHKKAASDAKRSKLFSKISRLISLAAKEKGGSPETNYKLKIAIDQAKEVNMPSENIERAIKRGAGGTAEEKLEEVVFEAYGPGGAAIIIEGITDNSNRTLAEIKKILNEGGGKMVTEGAVRWMFNRQGIIAAGMGDKKKEESELAAIESGAGDVRWQDDIMEVYTKPEEMENVKKSLEEKGMTIKSGLLGWSAKEEIALQKNDEESCLRLFEILDDNDSVQEIYSNIKLSENKQE